MNYFHFFLFSIFLDPKVDLYSSYDSLDKYNYALETLKLTDNNNYFNGNNCMLQPKCRQPYVHNGADNNQSDAIKKSDVITPKLPPRPPLPKSPNSSTTVDKDLAKQQQLSDWYYIKTGPKSPLPANRNDRNGIYSGVNQTNNSNPNKMETIYVKNTSINAVKMSRDPSSVIKNQNIYSENILKRGDSCNVQIIDANNSLERKCDRIQSSDADDDGYQAIGIPSTFDSAQRIYNPAKNHQYANDELLCKFNSRNNNAVEKVNGISKVSKWQPQHNDNKQLFALSTTSPSTSSSAPVTTQKMPNSQHPFYYVETSQNQQHLASPRYDRNKLHEQQQQLCTTEFEQKSLDKKPQQQQHQQNDIEQYEIASKLQYYNERLHSPNINGVPPTSTKLANTILNSNNVAAFMHQHQNHYNEMNSSSFEHEASSASEMAIPEKHQFNKSAGNFVTSEHQYSSNNVSDSRQCLQQQTMQMQIEQPQNRRRTPPPIPTLVSSTPSTVTLTTNQKVSRNYFFFKNRKIERKIIHPELYKYFCLKI